MILDFLLDALPGAPGPVPGPVPEHVPGQILGQVLHVGPGAETGQAWRGRGWTGLTLVEADPEAAAALREAYPETPGVRVVAGAATAGGRGRGRLARYGFADLDALKRPSGARLLYPGLERRDETEIDLVDPVALVQGLDLGDGRAHLLVLDAPGEARGLLAALAKAGLLARFARVAVREGRDELYQGGGTLDEIETVLRGAGFVVTGRDAGDPDRPWIRTDRDPRLGEIERLRAALEAADARSAALAAERERLVKERDEAVATSGASVKESENLKATLEAERQARDGRLALMREELLKAEGQIDFIADLLLGGSRL